MDNLTYCTPNRTKAIAARKGERQTADTSAAASVFINFACKTFLLYRLRDYGIPRLHALRALEVSLAVGDFGTGSSSMASLSSLPIDMLTNYV